MTAVWKNIRGKERVEMTKHNAGAIHVCAACTLNENLTLTFYFNARLICHFFIILSLVRLIKSIYAHNSGFAVE